MGIGPFLSGASDPNGFFGGNNPAVRPGTDPNALDINYLTDQQIRRQGSYMNPRHPFTYATPDGDLRYEGGDVISSSSALLDPNSSSSSSYEWGGRQGGAAEDVNRNRTIGALHGNRDAFQADYGRVDQSYGDAQDARSRAMYAAQLYTRAANGEGPSAAQSQLQQGLDKSIRAGQSMANSARGGGLARSAATRAAIGAAGDASLQAGQQAAQLRAQEMQAAMGGLANVTQGIRSQDLQQQGIAGQQAQFQAGMQQANRAQNDAARQFYEQQANVIQSQQLGAQQNKQGARRDLMRIGLGQQAQDAQNKAAKSAEEQAGWDRMMGFFGGAAGAALKVL